MKRNLTIAVVTVLTTAWTMMAAGCGNTAQSQVTDTSFQKVIDGNGYDSGWETYNPLYHFFSFNLMHK